MLNKRKKPYSAKQIANNNNLALQNLNKLILDQSFLEDINSIKSKLGLKNIEQKSNSKPFYPCNPDVLFQEADKVTKKYGLPWHYRDSIVRIIMNKPVAISPTTKLATKLYSGEQLSLEENLTGRIFIEVYPDTRLLDLRNFWTVNSDKIKPGADRKRTASKFDRDREIVKLHCEGKSNKEIKEKINKDKSANDIIDIQYVASIIKRFGLKKIKKQ